MIQFSFDDYHELNDKLFDLMSQYDYPVVWFIDFKVPRKANTQITKYHKAGHEIGNHTVTHPLLTRIKFDQVDDEINRAHELIKMRTGTYPTWFCPPRGYTNDIIDKFVKEMGYKHIRLTTRDKWIHIYPHEEYKGNTPFEEAEVRMKKGEDVHIWGHSWEIEKFGYWDRLKEFLDNNK